MTRPIHRLTALSVTKARGRGLYADGGGLYLQVSRNGSRSWLFRYTINSKTRHMGLGPADIVSLANARQAAIQCRRLCHEGIDPIAQREAKRVEIKLAIAKSVTFDDCAKRYIFAHAPAWRNDKHRAQWSATLRTYVSSTFGLLPVQDIDTGLVMRALQPIWTTKPETASRVRGRIEAILNWAKACGYRQGENPARWKGHLDNLLPQRGTTTTPTTTPVFRTPTTTPAPTYNNAR
jgi:integrase-like protein/Arm domain-containing DNA-binding protein